MRFACFIFWSLMVGKDVCVKLRLSLSSNDEQQERKEVAVQRPSARPERAAAVPLLSSADHTHFCPGVSADPAAVCRAPCSAPAGRFQKITWHDIWTPTQ